MTERQASFVIRGRVHPMAIGRIPPHFFCRVIRFAPKRIGRTSSGTFPASMALISQASAPKSLKPTSPSFGAISCLMCCGQRPSGPALEEVLNRPIETATYLGLTTRLGNSGASGNTMASEEAGCFAKNSDEGEQRPSEEKAPSRIAPGTSFSKT